MGQERRVSVSTWKSGCFAGGCDVCRGAGARVIVGSYIKPEPREKLRLDVEVGAGSGEKAGKRPAGQGNGYMKIWRGDE